MWLLLFLLLPLFVGSIAPSSTITSTETPTTATNAANATDEEYYEIVTDYITCANKRLRDGTFTYERCNRYANAGVFPFCVYMVTPSTATKRGSDAYGCVYAHLLPKECAEKGEFYSPYENISIHGEEHVGAMMCCMDNYCNQVEEPVFAMVRVKDDQGGSLDKSWPVLVATFIVLTGLMPLVHALLKNKTSAGLKRTERAVFLEESIGKVKNVRVVPQVQQQSMKFPNLRKMQDIVRTLLQPAKYGTTSTTNHENEAEKEDFKDLQKKEEVYLFQRDKEEPRKLERQIPSRYEHLAQRMIEHGPFFFDFDPVELGDLFDSVAQILSQEPTLLELQPEIDVYGNLEGSYGDLFRWMHKNGWPPKRKVLFLGGLTHDEEPYSLETITLIFAMKKLMPNHVFITRGVAEVYPIKIQEHRFTRRITRCLVDVIQRACGNLPLAATVNGVFFSHGGASPKIKKMKQIAEIKRPLNEIAHGSIAADLIFSQASSVDGHIPGSRGWQFSNKFEPDLHLPGKAKQKIQLVVRSRNPNTEGFMYINHQILSIWSAPGYPIENNGGCSLSFSHDMEMTINKMGVYGTYDQDAIAMHEENAKKLKLEEKKQRKVKPKKTTADKKESRTRNKSKEKTKSTEEEKDQKTQSSSKGNSKESVGSKEKTRKADSNVEKK